MNIILEVGVTGNTLGLAGKLVLGEGKVYWKGHGKMMMETTGKLMKFRRKQRRKLMKNKYLRNAGKEEFESDLEENTN